MKNETNPTNPTVTIPLCGLSSESLGQIIEMLNREGATISAFPGPELDAIARHYDRQLHVALLERYSRNLAAEKIRQEQATLRLLGASVSHTNPICIPA